LPEISEENAKSVIEKFIRQNGGCQLPCLFGITPGLSDASTVRHFVAYFQRDFLQVEDSPHNPNSIFVRASARQGSGGSIWNFRDNETTVIYEATFYYKANIVENIMKRTVK
jgi:hypothetical protein